MHLIDWAIVVIAVVGLRLISLDTRFHMKGVADFLSANRCAGRYLLTASTAMGGTGVVTFVALFEVYASRGFPPIWWQFASIPIVAIATLAGWTTYRFRETRAMTLAQFLEIRYSRRLRVFAGVLCWVAGILNFGIFPGVAARFLVYFCGLPGDFTIPGLPIHFPTFAFIMAADLLLALMFVTGGGQITVMVTECVQGIISSFAMIIIVLFIVFKLKWATIAGALGTAPAHASMLNPFDTGKVNDFNVWFYAIGLFGSIYNWMSWQGTQGVYSSARTPHEQKMGGIMAVWRQMPQSLMSIILPLAAFTILTDHSFTNLAAGINTTLKTIPNDSIAGEMRVPIAMAHYLPVGIKGLLATVMVYFSFTCHDTYMHSWGSIFVQDVIMPFKKKAITPEQHIHLLRWSIIGVGVFGWLFSFFYAPSNQILFFFAITAAIWLGGAGACIIGGLYWRKGTTAGAYVGLIVGAVVGVGGLIYPKVYLAQTGHAFPINDQIMYFISIVVASLGYVLVSLATCKSEFNLTRMLHRGKYAADVAPLPPTAKESLWLRLCGITNEFSFGDRILAASLVVWNFGWLAVFISVTIMNAIHPFGTAWWAGLWHFYIVIQLIISVPVTIWFSVGGIIDIRHLFHKLDNTVRDDTDDGRVEALPDENVDANLRGRERVPEEPETV